MEETQIADSKHFLQEKTERLRRVLNAVKNTLTRPSSLRILLALSHLSLLLLVPGAIFEMGTHSALRIEEKSQKSMVERVSKVLLRAIHSGELPLDLSSQKNVHQSFQTYNGLSLYYRILSANGEILYSGVPSEIQNSLTKTVTDRVVHRMESITYIHREDNLDTKETSLPQKSGRILGEIYSPFHTNTTGYAILHAVLDLSNYAKQLRNKSHIALQILLFLSHGPAVLSLWMIYASIRKERLNQPESKRNQLILSSLDSGIIAIDAEEKIIFSNPHAARMTGYPIFAMKQLSISDLLFTEEGNNWTNLILSNGQGTYDHTAQLRCKDGSLLPVQLSITSTPDSQSNIFATICFRQVNLNQNLLKEEKEARKKAEIANQNKGILLANISHELRTPLNAILGFSEFILKKPTHRTHIPQNYLEYAHNIYTSGEYLLQLVNNLLTLTQAEEKKLQLLRTQTDIPTLLQDCVQILSPALEKKNLSLELHIAKNIGGFFCDKLKLQQAILNILSNAIKFTDSGGKITISGKSNAQNDLWITIQDTGIGINQEEMTSLMERFAMSKEILHHPLKKGRELSFGIGLPLARELIQIQKGTLTIESVPQEHTTVTIFLPWDSTQDNSIGTKITNLPSLSGSSSAQSKTPLSSA